MHSFELYLNPAYSAVELARYVLYEVYNRLTIFGAEEVLIDVDPAIYDKFIKLFNAALYTNPKNENDKRGYFSLASFLNLVYEFKGEHQFRFTRVTAEELASIQSSTPVYQPASRDFTNLKGTYIGIDIGGSDIKIVVLKDGEVIYGYKENWTPESFSEATQHMEYFSRLIEKALAEAKLTLKDIQALGISFNLVTVNNRPTGQGPVVAGLKGEEVENIKVIATTLEEKLNLPVFILNDGKAGALWAAVRQNAPATVALALGTGLAGGYADSDLRVRDYLTEMGNVVLSLEEGALGHSYSQVPGAAQMYLSQRLTFELAARQGIDLSNIADKAEKLLYLQKLFSEGDPRVIFIFSEVARYMA
jgi:hypothetical protein